MARPTAVGWKWPPAMPLRLTPVRSTSTLGLMKATANCRTCSPTPPRNTTMVSTPRAEPTLLRSLPPHPPHLNNRPVTRIRCLRATRNPERPPATVHLPDTPTHRRLPDILTVPLPATPVRPQDIRPARPQGMARRPERMALPPDILTVLPPDTHPLARHPLPGVMVLRLPATPTPCRLALVVRLPPECPVECRPRQGFITVPVAVHTHPHLQRQPFPPHPPRDRSLRPRRGSRSPLQHLLPE